MEPAEKIKDEKETIRKDMLFRLKRQAEADRIAKSRRIKDLALKSSFFKKAGKLVLYFSTAEEVHTQELIEEALRMGKTVALPAIDSGMKEILAIIVKDTSSLIRGTYGIWEPPIVKENMLPLSEMDLVFVPGVAFDQWGHRLGRGSGYYDRFLAQLEARTVKVGLAFDFQMLEAVPTVPERDMTLDLVISS